MGTRKAPEKFRLPSNVEIARAYEEFCMLEARKQDTRQRYSNATESHQGEIMGEILALVADQEKLTRAMQAIGL